VDSEHIKIGVVVGAWGAGGPPGQERENFLGLIYGVNCKCTPEGEKVSFR